MIQVEKLTKHYGRRIGVEGLSFSVPRGSLFGFLGPNGAGKTTTIRVLIGLLKATGGSASIFGRDCWQESHRIKTDVGYLPGDLRLYPWLTCRSALSIFGRVRGRELLTPGFRLAEEFDLEPDLRVRRMSRGMRQKLGLILALAHHPQVLVLDEPTASLDPLMQEKLYHHLRALSGAGHTVFFSSHSLGEVERLCDRVAILREGRLMADDSLAALRERGRRRVTIRWRKDADAGRIAAPAFLEDVERDGGMWRAALAGPAMDLVRWSAAMPIEDLTIGQPDLNHLFQQYYSLE